GASCDSDSEERGIAEAITRNLFELSSVGVPVLSIIIGSGNSGGALALVIANKVWIAEDAYYSVISPEGFAYIVWKDSDLKKKASEIVEKIIPIFSDGERNSSNFAYLREKLILFANEYLSLSEQEIINQRYLRYRKF
ncbi:acetyl CoA carboxylase carboxyltransferase, partial [Enterococcus faecalis]|nr:acetyl CoA carboxylase carboxyltransferase [Enterococcus faecalis]